MNADGSIKVVVVVFVVSASLVFFKGCDFWFSGDRHCDCGPFSFSGSAPPGSALQDSSHTKALLILWIIAAL